MNEFVKKQLVEIVAEIDLGVSVTWERSGTDEYWEAMQRELRLAEKEFQEFIRDHRSRDRYTISFRKEYIYKCIFCGYAYDEIPSSPMTCCKEVIEQERISHLEKQV